MSGWTVPAIIGAPIVVGGGAALSMLLKEPIQRKEEAGSRGIAHGARAVVLLWGADVVP